MSTSAPITLGSGFNSGLPVEDIITQLMALERRPLELLASQKTKITQQQNAYNSVKTRIDALYASIQKLTLDTSSVLSTDSDIFLSKKSASSADTVATATVKSTAANQTISLEVISLATATKASSTTGVGQQITGTTPVTQAAMGSVTAGDFTFFVNGVAKTVTVASTDTLDDVLGKMTAADAAVSGTVSGGQIRIGFADGVSVQFGSANDTSNFLKAMKLTPGVFTDLPGATSEISSQLPVLALNPNVAIDGGAAGTNTAVTSGTFVINGKSFDTTGKSLNAIISEINNSGAKVTASFNPSNNKFELLSTEPGSAFISMADGTSNFLTAMGLVSGGNSTASQTVGQNAQISINGGPVIYSPGNTVDESITGLTGVSLDLKSAQPGTPITINITRDTDAIETAISDFVTKFNDALSFIDGMTKSNEDPNARGVLNGESSLKRFRQQLRQMVTDQVAALSGTGFDSLTAIGISTGAVSGTSTTASSTLVFDKEKFKDALTANPDAVRELVNGRAASDGQDGIMVQLESVLKNALSTTSGSEGLFSSYATAAASRISNLNDSIERGEARLVIREQNLRNQFLTMERLIGQYQQQGSALSGLQAQLAAQANG
ncbi:MAG: flagellar filament capping protein FliD [Vampirovibrionales bacterium]|nr:flagellar filament capping protein FliD [Vampirovibrionales bacterium]